MVATAMRRASEPPPTTPCLDLTLSLPRKPKTEWRIRSRLEHGGDAPQKRALHSAWTVPNTLPVDFDSPGSMQALQDELDRLFHNLMDTDEGCDEQGDIERAHPPMLQEAPMSESETRAKVDTKGHADICPICWEPIHATQILIHVCCGVALHRACSRRWDQHSGTCPWCRDGAPNPPERSALQPVLMDWDEIDDEDVDDDDSRSEQDDEEWLPTRPRDIERRFYGQCTPRTRSRTRRSIPDDPVDF